jgi:hypothetical protein
VTPGRRASQAGLGADDGWYVPGALGENGTSASPWRRAPGRVCAASAILGIVAGLAGCGGGTRQDASEPAGKFPVRVTKASFPNRQHISSVTDLVLAIRNAGKRTLPDLAVTIYTGDTKANGSFNIRLDQTNLANPSRPVWILENEYPKLLGAGVTLANVDHAPTAGAAAVQTDTFQFGPVKPGQSKQIVWRVTPAQAGTFTVHYEVAAGLQGKAKAVTPDGGPVKGEFVVTIGAKPPQTCVLPNGKVVSGSCQLGSGG